MPITLLEVEINHLPSKSLTQSIYLTSKLWKTGKIFNGKQLNRGGSGTYTFLSFTKVFAHLLATHLSLLLGRDRMEAGIPTQPEYSWFLQSHAEHLHQTRNSWSSFRRSQLPSRERKESYRPAFSPSAVCRDTMLYLTRMSYSELGWKAVGRAWQPWVWSYSCFGISAFHTQGVFAAGTLCSHLQGVKRASAQGKVRASIKFLR